MREIQLMANQSRRCGNTTFLLKAAIRNPKVVIVCIHQMHAMQVKKQYRSLIAKLPWWRKIFLKRVKGFPKFISPIDNITHLSGIPLVFDNSCLLK